jgi:hypothetical protein
MPVSNLFAAVWKVKFNTSCNQSLIEKGVRLTEAMTLAYHSLQAASARMNAENPVFLFAAPEYYWTRDGNYNLYDEGEKATIYSALQSTSAQLSNLLMFPGTVNWGVPVGQHVGTPPLNPKNKGLAAYNTAPVYLGGNLLLDYFKKFNDTFIDNRASAVFVPGPSNAAQSFDAKGLSFGLDVCGDLDQGHLSKKLVNARVDVMVVVSGSVEHNFTEAKISTVPVKNGGAFVHCDNSGKDIKNGVWALNRGQGWHGTARGDAITLSFEDIDNKKRIIEFPPYAKDVPGPKMKIAAVLGFGTLRELTATVITRDSWIRKFSLDLPGSGRTQTAVFKKDGDHYKITLSRAFSRGKTTEAKLIQAEAFGMRTTGRGNVSKIGKLQPPVGDPDLDCYTLSISN